MTKTTKSNTVESGLAKERSALIALAQNHLTPGVEREGSLSGWLHESLGVAEGSIPRRVGDRLIEAGILSRRGPVYGGTTTGLSAGRHYFYTLNYPLPEALEILEKDQERRLENWRATGRYDGQQKQPSKDREVVRAIVGPDKDPGLAAHLSEETIAALKGLRKDESAALVEAARQYADRDDRFSGLIEDLEREAASMGIAFDRTMAEQMFTKQHDERLETIGLVLPYITSLEGRIDTLIAQLGELRRKYADYDELKREVRALRAARDQRLTTSTGGSFVTMSSNH